MEQSSVLVFYVVVVVLILIVWSLGKELLIQLRLLIALLFWAFPDIFLGFVWPFVFIKTRGCCISLWLTARKWSEGIGLCTHQGSCQKVLHSSEMCWTATDSEWGNICCGEWGKCSGSGENWFEEEVFSCDFWCGLRVGVPFWQLWGAFSFSTCCGDSSLSISFLALCTARDGSVPSFWMTKPAPWCCEIPSLCLWKADRSQLWLCAVDLVPKSSQTLLCLHYP